MDETFDAVSLVEYDGHVVLMFRPEGSYTWSSIPLD